MGKARSFVAATLMILTAVSLVRLGPRLSSSPVLAQSCARIVSDPAENLQSVVDQAHPGDIICVTVDTDQKVVLERTSGTEDHPITLISKPRYKKLAGLYIKAQWWIVDGFDFDGELFDGKDGRPQLKTIKFLEGANHSTVQNCKVHHTYGGINIDTGIDNRVINNEIYKIQGGGDQDAHCMSHQGRNMKIIGNLVYDCHGDGIQFGYTRDMGYTQVIGNQFFLKDTPPDCAENALDFKGGSSGGEYTLVAHNIMHGYRYPSATPDTHCGSDSKRGYAVVIHNWAANLIFDSNRIYDTTGVFQVTPGNANLKFYNNIIHPDHPDGKKGELHNVFILSGAPGVEIYHNTIVDVEGNWGGRNDPQVSKNNLLIHASGGIPLENNLQFNQGTLEDALRQAGVSGHLGDQPFYPQSPDSPVVDAGIDTGITSDFGDNPRPAGSGFDIGAWEYESSGPIPTPTPTPGPLTFKQLLLNWLTPTFDQNSDGKVNSLDFAILNARR